MMIITIDIETDYTHDPSIVEKVIQNISPPANIKKQETIIKWWSEKGNDLKVEAQRKTALNALYGSVRMIGWAANDRDPQIIIGEESSVLIKFFEIMDTLYDTHKAPPVVIGHNVKNFDLDFIRKRAIVNRVKMPRWMNTYFTRYSQDVFDTMESWAGWGKHIKLDDLAYGLLGEGKSGKGSDVFNMNNEECAAYCKQDVDLTRNIYKLMIGE
jgi:DNA polymerase elongation subunit (family B)